MESFAQIIANTGFRDTGYGQVFHIIHHISIDFYENTVCKWSEDGWIHINEVSYEDSLEYGFHADHGVTVDFQLTLEGKSVIELYQL